MAVFGFLLVSLFLFFGDPVVACSLWPDPGCMKWGCDSVVLRKGSVIRTKQPGALTASLSTYDFHQ